MLTRLFLAKTIQHFPSLFYNRLLQSQRLIYDAPKEAPKDETETGPKVPKVMPSFDDVLKEIIKKKEFPVDSTDTINTLADKILAEIKIPGLDTEVIKKEMMASIIENLEKLVKNGVEATPANAALNPTEILQKIIKEQKIASVKVVKYDEGWGLQLLTEKGEVINLKPNGIPMDQLPQIPGLAPFKPYIPNVPGFDPALGGPQRGWYPEHPRPLDPKAIPIPVPRPGQPGVPESKEKPVRTTRDISGAQALEAAELQKATEAQALRDKVFLKENVRDGKVAPRKDAMLPAQLDEIYKDAPEGSQLAVRRTYKEGNDVKVLKLLLERHDGKWEIVKPENLKGKKYFIYGNDRLSFVPNENAQPEKPEPLDKKLKTAGVVLLDGDVGKSVYDFTNEIAPAIMRTGTRLKLTPFSKLGQGYENPVAGSPAKDLKDLGYDLNNPDDVKAYGNLLAENNPQPTTKDPRQARYIVIVVPREPNPRLQREADKVEQKAAIKNDVGMQATVFETQGARLTEIRNRHAKDLLANNDTTLSTNVVRALDNEKLFDAFWKGEMDPSAQALIKEGFLRMGVDESMIPSILYDAITHWSDEKVNMEDIFDACKKHGVTIFTSLNKGGINDFDSFVDEYKFYEVASKVAKNKEENHDLMTGLTSEEKDIYNDGKDDYKADASRFTMLRNTLESTALVFEGLNNLKLLANVDQIQKRLNEAEQHPEKNNEVPAGLNEAEMFLARDLGLNPRLEISKDRRQDRQASSLEKAASPAEAFWSIVELARQYDSDPKTGHATKKGMAQALNDMIRAALIPAKSMPDSQGTLLAEEKQRLMKRYNLEAIGINPYDPELIPKGLSAYGFNENLQGDPSKREVVKLLVADGFVVHRSMARDGLLEKREFDENDSRAKGWVSIDNMYRMVRYHEAADAVAQLLARHPEEALTPDQVNEMLKTVDQAFSESQAISLDVGFKGSTTEGAQNLYVGVSKVWQLPKGWSFVVGGGLGVPLAGNDHTPSPVLGIVFSKTNNHSEQWKSSVSVALGAMVDNLSGVPNPALMAGVQGGFTYMTPAKYDSAWRGYVESGAVAGAKLSLKPSDAILGAGMYVGGGYKKDVGGQYRKLVGNELAQSELAKLKNIPPDNIELKALRLRSIMKNNLGNILTEVQYNLKLTDKQLCDLADKMLIDKIMELSFNKALDSASGVSEVGFGILFTPAHMAVLAAVLATLGPAVAAALAIGMYARFGVIVDKDVIVINKLKYQRANQVASADEAMASMTKMVEETKAIMPGANIKITAEELDESTSLKSRILTGNQLDRELTPDQLNRVQARNGGKPVDVQMQEIRVEGGSFEELRAEYLKNGIDLSIDQATGMYKIDAVGGQAVRFFVDPILEAQYGFRLRGNEILVAAPANLAGLLMKRLYYTYPDRTETGGNNVVDIVLTRATDDPKKQRRMGDIMEQSAEYIAARFDMASFSRKPYEPVKAYWNTGKNLVQYNIGMYNQAETNLYTSKTLPANVQQQLQESQKDQETERKHQGLTNEALALMKPMTNTDVYKLPMPPEEFIKNKAYEKMYREVTKGRWNKDITPLLEAIRKENPSITHEEEIVYVERLFDLAMKEIQDPKGKKETFFRRLRWAEEYVYPTLFKSLINQARARGRDIPPEIDEIRLTRAFIADLESHINEAEPIDLPEGVSVETAVGFGINGVRGLAPYSKQFPSEYQFREAYDYSKILATTNAQRTGLNQEEVILAELLCDLHSPIYLGEGAEATFLNKPIPSKLFFLGDKDKASNPLIDLVGEDTFKQLTEAYKIAKNEKLTPDEKNAGAAKFKEAVSKFYEICKDVREAQLGNGVPMKLNGEDYMAVPIGDYYVAIKTYLKNGVYEDCQNPSSAYSEDIQVFRKPPRKPPVLQVGRGQVASAAADNLVEESKIAKVTTIGLHGAAVMTIEMGQTPPEEEKGVNEEGSTGEKGIEDKNKPADDHNAGNPQDETHTTGNVG